MANPFAYLVLALFIPAAVLVFGRFPPAPASVGLALAGFLLLPERAGLNLEGLPSLNKESITYLGILAGACVHRSRLLAGAGPGRGPEALFLLLVLANALTVAANRGPVAGPEGVVPGQSLYGIVSLCSNDFLRYALPFFLGRALCRNPSDLRQLMAALAGGGLLYSLLILVEIGLSGVFQVFQFGAWFYGVVTAEPSFRYGGIQPVVFLTNPLALATFVASCSVAAAGIARAGLRLWRVAALPICLWLVFVLVLCRNLASIVYGVSFVVLVRGLRPRAVAWACLGLALFVGSYPLLRIQGLFPYESLLAVARDFDPERARSLAGRFKEEDQLLEQGWGSLLIGWGNYDRIPIALEPETGSKGIDGFWIIVTGIQGLLGLELRMAFLLIPIAVAWRARLRGWSSQDRALLAALSAIVAIRAVDLLPNGWWTSLPAFLAGALFRISRCPEPNGGRERGRGRRAGGAQAPRSSSRRRAARSTFPFALSGSTGRKRISRGSM